MYGTFTLSLVVDVKTGTIINCSDNMIMSDTIDFLRQIIEGKNLVTGLRICSKSAFGPIPKKAVVAALKDAQNRFLMAYPDLARGPWGGAGWAFPFAPLLGGCLFPVWRRGPATTERRSIKVRLLPVPISF